MSSNNSNKKIEISPLLSNNTQNINAISSQYTNSRNNLQRQINNITSEKNSEHLPLVSSEQNMSTIGAGSGPGATPPQTTTNQTLSRNNRRRQMNRSRQNIVLYQSDIDWAIKNLVYAVKNNLNLIDLQKDLLYGTFYESQRAKRELESYLYVLENLEYNKQIRNTFISLLPYKIREKMGLEAGSFISLMSIGVICTLIGTATAGPVALIPLGLYFIGMGTFLIKHTQAVTRVATLGEIRDYIRIILDKDKKRIINTKNFIMSHQNTRKNNTNNNNNNKSKRRSTIKKQYSPTKQDFYKKNKFSF